MSDEMDEGLDLEPDNSFDNFDKKKTLGDLWRDSPLVKIGVMVAAAVIIFGGIILFGSAGPKPDPSIVPSGQSVSETPGSGELSPTYKNAIEEQNETRIEEAQKEGTSALPTPVTPSSEALSLPEQQETAEDPLQRWRKLQEERVAQEPAAEAQAPQGPTPEETARNEALEAISNAMSQQMKAILDGRTPKTVQVRNLTSQSWLDQLREKEKADLQAASVAAEADTDSQELQVILFPAGEIAYGQLITEANSDAPGPVVAQITSGPLRGSRVLGDFEVKKDWLTLNFDKVVIKGVSQDIDAVALDPASTLPALATDVDHHYLKKIALPMAAAFVEGAANAISNSGLTTVTIQGETVAQSTEDADSDQQIASGIDEAGQELRDILDEEKQKIETTIRIEKGTAIGILFLDPVIDESKQNQTQIP